MRQPRRQDSGVLLARAGDAGAVDAKDGRVELGFVGAGDVHRTGDLGDNVVQIELDHL